MKHLILTLCGMALVTLSLGQKVTPPKAAENDLKARFPNVANARWEQEGNHFEAEWKENGLEVAVLYDATGKWIMTERIIPSSSIPAEVVQSVSASFPGAEMLEAERQEKSNGQIGFQVEVRHQGKVREITLDSAGNVIADEIEGDDEDGDEEDDD